MLSELEATRWALLLTTLASGYVGAHPLHQLLPSKMDAYLSASDPILDASFPVATAFWATFSSCWSF